MVARLFQIVYLLMERDSMTAKELADKLEVSVRTINRDIEKLSEFWYSTMFTEIGRASCRERV